MISTLRLCGKIFLSRTMKTKNDWDTFESRVLQASASTTTLVRFFERLAELMAATSLDAFDLADGIRDAGDTRILPWIRANPKIAASLSHLSYRDSDHFVELADQLEEELRETKLGDVLPQRMAPEIPIKVTTHAPLSHGGDEKAGNATLFRRAVCRANNGGLLAVPYYAANAFRGQMRDLLAHHFLQSLGIQPSKRNPPVSIWFFNLIYGGGGLEQDSGKNKKAKKAVGERANAYDLSSRADIRDRFPWLSLFGFSLGRSIFEGKFEAHDFLPRCAEVGTGSEPMDSLLSWEFLTRRDDLEGDHEDNSSMIATHETMVLGSVLDGGVSTRPHIRPMERAALEMGLCLIQSQGRLGGCSRRGWGVVAIDLGIDADLCQKYNDFLAETKAETLTFLREIDAIAAEPTRTTLFDDGLDDACD